MRLRIPNVRNFQEYRFFSVALIGDVLSIGICFFDIYPKSKVIKYGSFHERIQNAMIIAGKNGILLNDISPDSWFLIPCPLLLMR